MRSVYVISNGCHESFLDAAQLERFFQAKPDFTVVKDIANADLIVLLGCSVMQPKEDMTRELIKVISEQKRADAELLVAGCIAKVRPDLVYRDNKFNTLIQEIDDLLRSKGGSQEFKANFPYRPYRDSKKDLLTIVRTRERKRRLNQYASSLGGPLRTVTQKFSGPITYMLSKYGDFVESRIDVWDNKTYTIKISTGCRGNCSYCSIKQSRGEICSKPIKAVIKEFKAGLQQGYSDFALIGTDIGDYGKDMGTDLLDLLKAIVRLVGQFQVRLRNVNPRWLIPSAPQFCDLLTSGKISYIESPIQSCSNRILKLMNRGYRAEDYLDAMRKIRSTCPRVFLKSQIIVGFPSESDEDFRKFLKLYESKLFNYVDVFPYSNRPNTRASTMLNQVPYEIIMKRRQKLLFKSLFQLAPKQLFCQFIGRS